MIVVDASAWVCALVDSEGGADVRRLLEDDPDWLAPAHLPLETLRTIRRFELAELLTAEQAGGFAAEVFAAAIRYATPEPEFLEAIWLLRHNLSLYDAPYVVLALTRAVPLITFDARLATAAVQLGATVIVPTAG